MLLEKARNEDKHARRKHKLEKAHSLKAKDELIHALPGLRMDQIQKTTVDFLSKQEGKEKAKTPSDATVPLIHAKKAYLRSRLWYLPAYAALT